MKSRQQIHSRAALVAAAPAKPQQSQQQMQQPQNLSRSQQLQQQQHLEAASISSKLAQMHLHHHHQHQHQSHQMQAHSCANYSGHSNSAAFAAINVQQQLVTDGAELRKRHHDHQYHNMQHLHTTTTNNNNSHLKGCGGRHCVNHENDQIASGDHGNNYQQSELQGEIDDEISYRNQLRQHQMGQQYAPRLLHHQQQQQASRSESSQSDGSGPQQVSNKSIAQTKEAQSTAQHHPNPHHQNSNNNHNQLQQHVNFGIYQQPEQEQNDRKKKYLTAKYGAHQMSLIKKRLKVEMWLHDELQELAKQTAGADSELADDIEIDLDEMLDMEDDATRIHWLQKMLEPLSTKTSDGDKINKFIVKILEQTKLL